MALDRSDVIPIMVLISPENKNFHLIMGSEVFANECLETALETSNDLQLIALNVSTELKN